MLFSTEECSTTSTEKEYSSGCQKNKKKTKPGGVNTDGYEIVVLVTQSSGYWSIYIDWQRSY